MNHFKSKNCDPEPTGGDVDSGDGQGCYNATQDRAGDRARRLRRRRSRPPPAIPTCWSSATSTHTRRRTRSGHWSQRGLSDQIERFVGKDAAYSFIFDGQSGYLDHALATAALGGQVNDVTEWHINADEPSVIDYNLEFKPQDLYTPTPYRSSDHDPVVVGLDLGRCQFADNAVAGCGHCSATAAPPSTLGVPDGWTFDGAGFTVSAYGGLSGAVVDERGQRSTRARRDDRAVCAGRDVHGVDRRPTGRHERVGDGDLDRRGRDARTSSASRSATRRLGCGTVPWSSSATTTSAGPAPVCWPRRHGHRRRWEPDQRQHLFGVRGAAAGRGASAAQRVHRKRPEHLPSMR